MAIKLLTKTIQQNNIEKQKLIVSQGINNTKFDLSPVDPFEDNRSQKKKKSNKHIL